MSPQYITDGHGAASSSKFLKWFELTFEKGKLRLRKGTQLAEAVRAGGKIQVLDT